MSSRWRWTASARSPTRAAYSERVLKELSAVLPDDGLLTDPDVVLSYAHDQANLSEYGKPACVALPRSTEEVAAVVQVAARHGTPIVPRGAGSGLSGGANAIDGCIVLSLARMDRILDIDTDNLVAVVQPGVLNGDFSAAVGELGLAYPPDPASAAFCTIGGNVATNAGGLCCVKYGVTSDYVLGLEVVLPDGEIVRTGRRTRKGVAGYDLTRLFVGSEGTLGIVTEVTLRLVAAPAAPALFVAFFDDLVAAGEAVRAITTSAATPSLLEMMDRRTIGAVEDLTRMGLDRDAAALLMGESDAPGGQGAEDAAAWAKMCESAGATYVVHTSDPDERGQLLAARRVAFSALERLGTPLLDDVAVPLTRIPELLAAVPGIEARHGLPVATFGHAGDGNMHPTIVYDATDEDSRARAFAAFDDIVGLALELGGTVTGEHGVGTLKRDWLTRELGPGGMRIHAAVKAALDPANIMNPGKVLQREEKTTPAAGKSSQ